MTVGRLFVDIRKNQLEHPSQESATAGSIPNPQSDKTDHHFAADRRHGAGLRQQKELCQIPGFSTSDRIDPGGGPPHGNRNDQPLIGDRHKRLSATTDEAGRPTQTRPIRVSHYRHHPIGRKLQQLWLASRPVQEPVLPVRVASSSNSGAATYPPTPLRFRVGSMSFCSAALAPLPDEGIAPEAWNKFFPPSANRKKHKPHPHNYRPHEWQGSRRGRCDC